MPTDMKQSGISGISNRKEMSIEEILKNLATEE